MRLKEITPGMVIRCKNDEEKKLLLQEAERLGYFWAGHKVPTDYYMMKHSGMTIHFYDKNKSCDFAHITWSDNTDGVTEFSDLIIPELTAEEALLAYDQMCKENYCCNDCPIYGILGHECAHKMDGHITEIVNAIKKWKADHDKKEPEIETVDICRIIEVLPEGRKRCVHEEDLASGSTDAEIKILVEAELKRYCMEHDGEFIAVHEVVSRAKAAE